MLLFGDNEISSEDGLQKCGPLDPLFFCLSIHNILLSLKSKIKVAYPEDITIIGKEDDDLTFSSDLTEL